MNKHSYIVQHLNKLKSEYNQIIKDNENKIEELEKELWQLESETSLTETLRNSGKAGGKYYEIFENEFENKKTRIAAIDAELIVLKNKDLRDERTMIHQIDRQIQHIKHFFL